jgi:hypothetical protein
MGKADADPEQCGPWPESQVGQKDLAPTLQWLQGAFATNRYIACNDSLQVRCSAQ